MPSVRDKLSKRKLKDDKSLDKANKELKDFGIDSKIVNINKNPFTKDEIKRLKKARKQLKDLR